MHNTNIRECSNYGVISASFINNCTARGPKLPYNGQQAVQKHCNNTCMPRKQLLVAWSRSYSVSLESTVKKLPCYSEESRKREDCI